MSRPPAGAQSETPHRGRLVRVRRRAWITLAVGLAVLVAAAGGGAYAWLHRPQASTARVTDANGHISVEVPATWRQARIGGWSPAALVAGALRGDALAASPDLIGWADPQSSTPGVFVGTTTAAASLSDTELLGKVTHPECTKDGPEKAASGSLTGTRDHWTCQTARLTYDEVILRPADNAYVVYLQVKQAAGGTATSGLLDSLRVTE